MEQISIQHITYRWADQCPFDGSAGPDFWPVTWTFDAPAALRLWHERVQPWLMTAPNGTPQPNYFYSVFETDAVLIRRNQRRGAANATAHLLIGSRTGLPADLALLQMWSWDRDRLPGQRQLAAEDVAEFQRELHRSVRDRETVALLRPMLSQVLSGPRPIVGPAGEATHALLWAIQEIMTVLGTGLPGGEVWPMSFETYDDRPHPAERDGLSLRFRPDIRVPLPDMRTSDVASRLVTTYLSDGPNGLRAMLNQNRVLEGRTMADRVDLMTQIWQSLLKPRPTNTGATIPPRTPRTTSAPRPTPAPAPAGTGSTVICPICLGHLDWHGLPYFRYDDDAEQYVPLDLDDSATPEQRAREQRGAAIRCPNTSAAAGEHFLPSSFGKFGRPAIFGFIGASQTGKSHLLAAMVAGIEQGGLHEYGIKAQPIDLRRHRRFLLNTVRPLIMDGHKIAATDEKIVEFVDGFIITASGGSPRPVAFFDVSGVDLARADETKEFLEIADGLVFVADPVLFAENSLGDVTFGLTLDLLQDSGRLSEVSAAVVLNKADLRRFDDPIAFWLRQADQALEAESVLRESADVYAYLHQQGARAWTRPYDECAKATLHVASALGSDSFDRTVRPRRVLRPLVALIAMAGFLTTPDAANIGA